MKRLTALVTGFGPFPGAPVNPSAALVRAISRMRRPVFADTKIVTHIFPVSYSAIAAGLPELVSKHKPDIVLMFGLSSGAKTLRVESQGINANSMLHPDVSGRASAKKPLASNAPASLKAAAPLAALIAAARSAGVNANVSHNAGRYICNAALYTCLDLRREAGRPSLVAFIHIPWPRRPLPGAKAANRRRPTARMLALAGAAILASLIAAARRR